MNFCIFGEDARHDYVTAYLLSAGWKQASPADLIILSVGEPFSVHKDSGRNGCFVFGGKKEDETAIKQAGFQKLTVSSNYRKKNSAYTAEGALALAIYTLPTALCESTVLIHGYGYLGKECSRLFRCAGASVLVLTYAENEKKEAEDNGFPVITINDRLFLSELLMVNTIPVSMFRKKNLLIPSSCSPVLIELASTSCLFEEIEGLTVLNGKALPARFSPVSAAKLMYQEIAAFFEHYKFSYLNET